MRIAEPGHEVSDADLLISLHAGKTADAVNAFRTQFPRRPIIVVVTGTDIYPGPLTENVVRSLQIADRVVALQEAIVADLPDFCQKKTRVIYQSTESYSGERLPPSSGFEVGISGHLRTVKDPFLLAQALRMLPSHSQIHATHIGGELDPGYAEQALQEVAENPRYRWLGELPRLQARAKMARCRLMVLTSLAEGGPAVIAESLLDDVPILATRTSGAIGMLGKDYPGLFDIGNATQLRDLLLRAESDPDFLARLQAAGRQRQPYFRRERELQSWQVLLSELTENDYRMMTP